MQMRRLEILLTEALAKHLSTPGSVPQIPEAGALAWRWFLDLNQTRTTGYAGPDPIQYADILAYSQISGWGLEKRHIDLIRALDRAFMDHIRSQQAEGSSQPGTLPRSSGQDINPALFDAVF